MRLLLQLSFAAADDGSVLERADDGTNSVPRRMLLVQRVVRRRRRALRSRRVRHWLVRLLCEHSFVAADCAANCHADSRTDGRSDSSTDGRADYHADGRADSWTDGCADECTIGHADNASNRAANVNADAPSVSRLVHDRNRSSGGRMRKPRRHLLHW